jgi:hypothetical protein
MDYGLAYSTNFISPHHQAGLLGTKIITLNQKQKRAKARQKSGPGSLACSAEAFFCLDFFGPFCIKTKRTSHRGN